MAGSERETSTTALMVVDVFDDFDHEDGARVLDEMRARAGGIEAALATARERGWRVVFANDEHGHGGDADALIRTALAGPGGDVAERFLPRPGEEVVTKPDYSAFDRTPMRERLDAMGVRRLLVLGAVTEMCVRETAADAARAGYATSVVWDASVPLDEDDEREALAELDRLGVEVLGGLAEAAPDPV
ncbi:cysteine hydrolase family protein [Miltoncostaea marina]|uniref:cysteine hydrolase family protein n=1 Tax=Miltoncostaea marina TaxID=2843215 RepID=UPI001C3CBBC2|nr:isochorismatase family cysteine hydrolase [Miltoncostaea marina]